MYESNIIIMKRILPLVFAIIALIGLANAQEKSLFFSEYVEGSGNNKALEIYNPTAEPVDLDPYYVLRYSNGSSSFTSGGMVDLEGIIQPYSTFVLVNGQQTDSEISPAPDPELQALADQLDDPYPAPTYMNGNDAIALVISTDGNPPSSGNFTPIDLFGEIGLGDIMENGEGWSNIKDSVITYNANETQVQATITDYVVPDASDDGTASFGPYWLAWTANRVLIRKPEIVKGVQQNPNPFVVTTEWDTLTGYVNDDGFWTQEDNWSNLGIHESVADPVTSIHRISKPHITIYPNPLLGSDLTIKANQVIESITFMNILGQPLKSIYPSSKDARLILENAEYGDGIYFIDVKMENNLRLTKKIILK